MKLFIKRLLLTFIGIILSLILLECGLRLAGWTISSYQQYKNNKALKNRSQYTIMCLGESTTQGQYPVQLQEILNEKYPNKFSVIDCGIESTTLETILDLLDNNIKKYKPNIAICMMGINNGFSIDNIDTNINYIKTKKRKNLKIYNLLILLKKHLVALKTNFDLFAYEIENKSNLEQEFNQAINYINTKENKKAITLFNNIIEQNKNYKEQVYPYLVSLYGYETQTQEKALQISIEGIYKNFKINRQKYYEQAIFVYYNTNKLEQAIEILDKMLSENIKISLKSYTTIKKLVTKEKLKEITNNLEIINEINAFYAIEKIEDKNYQQAEEYFNKAETIRLNFPNIETYNLYKLIVKKLIDHNIKVICMQYPVRSILSLQEQLKNEPYYDKITFISNEKLFKDALMKKNYDDLFNDQFAGDFGHCTDLGNTLIAKNVVNTLENILDLKEK